MSKLIKPLWLTASIFVLMSCEKEVLPTANFSYEIANTELRKHITVFPVQEAIQFYNKSDDAASYAWDFGDGTTSTDKEPVVVLKKSGVYTVSLTATSSTGAKRTSSQSIKVVDRILKRVIVRRLKWNAFGDLPGWESNSKRADLTIELGTISNGNSYTKPGKVLYQTQPLKSVGNTTTSFEVPVTQKVILNPDVLPYDLLLNVYGNDGGGNQLVYSNRYGGAGFAFDLSTVTGLYTFETGLVGTDVLLECGYE